jgi:hypothetical protein
MRTTNGAASVRTTVAPAITSRARVMSRSTKSLPPSGSLKALTICGTRTAFSTPPAMRM